MDIRHLRTFVTVARLGSITRAAEALHLTQPAVSGQIKTLEEALEVQLLSRTTTSVTLTQCGQELLRKAQQAVECFGDFVHAAKSFRGQVSGRLRVGVTMLDPEMLRVGPFMREMVTHHPALKIDLHVGRIAWLLDALRGAELDAAIFVCKSVPKGMSGILLRHLTYRVVAPTAWRERLVGATWQDAAQMPWIRMPPRSAHDELMREVLKQAGIQPVETVEADHEALIHALVSAGVGMSLLRDELTDSGEARGELFAFRDASVTTQLVFIYPEERESDLAITASVNVLQNLWNCVASTESVAIASNFT